MVDAVAFVSTTSSNEAVQGLFEIVHRNVALVPAGTPVIPDDGEEAVVIRAVPLINVQVPAPVVGVLAVIVKLPLLQLFLSVPALAVVGLRLNVTSTSSVDAQAPLVIVHLKVYAVPAVPLKVVAGFDAATKLPPAPLTILHAPVPVTGLLAANVTAVNPQVAAPV